jgi:hypothetical protein
VKLTHVFNIFHHLALVEGKFRKVVLVPSSGKTVYPALLDPLDGANLNHKRQL